MQDGPRGFGRGLAAERILGMRISFPIKWKGNDVMDFVSAKEAKAKIP